MYGQINLFDMHKKPYKIKNRIMLIELFGGIGSQAMGLRNIGADFVHHRLIEFDRFACASYNAIHHTNFEPTDIREVHGVDLGIDDVKSFTYLLTLFPCQDISVAGKGRGFSKENQQNGKATRSGLLWEVERILKELHEDKDLNLPQILLMENVPNVHGSENISDFYEWIHFLESIGYDNYWQDMNACDFGTPQSRNRCFMVSVPKGYKYEFPRPFPLKKTMKDYLEPKVDKKFYLLTDKAKMLIDKLILNGKILTDRQTDRQTDIHS